jgi:hypothetical protein
MYGSLGHVSMAVFRRHSMQPRADGRLSRTPHALEKLQAAVLQFFWQPGLHARSTPHGRWNIPVCPNG